MKNFKQYMNEGTGRFKPGRIRKVKAKWYTITVYDHDDTLFDKTQDKELYFDIIRRGTGKWASWDVTYRQDMYMNQVELDTIASFDNLANAKKYTLALYQAWIKKAREVPNAEDFEEFAFNGNRFSGKDPWLWSALKQEYK